MAMAKDGDEAKARAEAKTRAAMVACMEHLDGLDQADARRVLRSLAIWFEDEEDRTLRFDNIVEALGDIGRALSEGR